MAAIVMHDIPEGCHEFSCTFFCVREAALPSHHPTDLCTVRAVVTSKRCWTQKKSCAEGRDLSLCNLDKDGDGGEEHGVGRKHLVDLENQKNSRQSEYENMDQNEEGYIKKPVII